MHTNLDPHTNPDPLVKGMDPRIRIRIRTKISWIRSVSTLAGMEICVVMSLNNYQ
jgi:hypothetical protein